MNEIKLVKKTYSQNAIGEPVATETERTVYANVSSVSEREFFDAGQSGLKPDRKFIIKTCEYDHETIIICGTDRFSVYRTYERDDGRIELYTERKVGER